MGIHLVHSKPYAPQGRGKQERLNRYIRERFLLEAETTGITSFEELNDRFTAWAESVANNRTHAETGQKPFTRFFTYGGHHKPGLPTQTQLSEAFRWSVTRVVTKTATVSFQANRYTVDASLVGRRVELRFDPEDLTIIDVYADGAAVGQAVPFTIGRHVHPAVPQAQPELPPEPKAPGIDYLGIVTRDHERAELGSIPYRDIPLPGIADTEEAL